jgi:hypothetical protein
MFDKVLGMKLSGSTLIFDCQTYKKPTQGELPASAFAHHDGFKAIPVKELS